MNDPDVKAFFVNLGSILLGIALGVGLLQICFSLNSRSAIGAIMLIFAIPLCTPQKLAYLWSLLRRDGRAHSRGVVLWTWALICAIIGTILSAPFVHGQQLGAVAITGTVLFFYIIVACVRNFPELPRWSSETGSGATGGYPGYYPGADARVNSQHTYGQSMDDERRARDSREQDQAARAAAENARLQAYAENQARIDRQQAEDRERLERQRKEAEERRPRGF